MDTRVSPILRAVLVWAVVVLCVGFAPVAAEFGFVTLQGGTPTYARILAGLVSEPFAYGPESGFAQLTPHWTSMSSWLQLTLAVHAVLASVVLLCCLGLLHDGLRRRWPTRHRQVGRVTAVLALIAMVLAVVYLLATPMTAIYGGPPFALGLWGMAVLSVWALGMGVDRARRGHIDAHKAFMVLFAAALFVAPSLRLHWILFGWLLGTGPHATQATAHVLALVVLSVQTPVLAIAAMAGHRRSSTLRLVLPAPLLALPLLIAVGLAWSGSASFFAPLGVKGSELALGVGAVFLAAATVPPATQPPTWLVVAGLGMVLAGFGGAFVQAWPTEGLAAPHLALGRGAFLLALAVVIGVFAGFALVAGRNGDAGLVHEMGVHGLALTALPAAHALGLGWGLRAGLAPADAWLGSMVLAPGVLLSFSYYVTAFRGSIAAGARGMAAPFPVSPGS